MLRLSKFERLINGALVKRQLIWTFLGRNLTTGSLSPFGWGLAAMAGRQNGVVQCSTSDST